MWDDAPTYDEIVHPAVGYAELLTGELRLIKDHPPLPRFLTALPLLAFNPKVPLEHESWQKRPKGPGDRFDFGHQFFYVANDNADRMLFWSRFPTVLLSMLLGVLVYKWAKELYGNTAGLLALFLYSFEPNIIAHSRLTKNDLILTLFIFSTLYQLWQFCNTRSSKSLILTGITLGLSLLSKFSAIMLLPMIFLLVWLVPGTDMPDPRHDPSVLNSTVRKAGKRLGVSFLTVSLMFMIAMGLVLVCYGSQWKLFVEGLLNAVFYHQAWHHAFLLGSHSTEGWWYYFPMAFLLKTPIPLLIFIMVAFLFSSYRKDRAEYFLLVPAGIFTFVAMLGHINIGLRHILPVYPFLIVLAGSVTRIRPTRPWFFVICLIGLTAWNLFSTLSIFPSYLAYFNEFVGPKKGYLMLVDSNLDWGQDLKRLKRFLDEKGIDRVYMSYFGTADPCYYKIRFVSLPGNPPGCGREPRDLRADFIAISATNLQSVYLFHKGSFEWLKAYKPIAQIGYSIFVYDIRGNASSHADLGILYLQYQMLNEALHEFKVAVEMAPGKATAYSNLGFAYSRLFMFDEAEEAYKKALELDPENRAAKAGLEAADRVKNRNLKSRQDLVPEQSSSSE
jgi:hypothetical protein